MKKFDPFYVRQILDGGTGYRFFLTFDFEKAKNAGGLASSASAYINMAVKCILVGYDAPADQLLHRAFDWLTVAIKEHEKPPAYGADGTEAERFFNLAMCNWLLHGKHDAESLNRFVEHEDRFLLSSKMWREKTNVSLTLVNYVDAGANEKVLEWFGKAALSIPKSSGAVRNEGQMCYIISRHRLGQKYLEIEIESAIEKFLKRSVNGWLTDGHFSRAAEWMKVVHWQEGKADISPKEAVLKCYEYLSDVALPKPEK